ncbi:cytochrome c3 family protein [Geobacter argillaceus]|uniref:Putative CXXCH cytochrome family protein n=1 Tax=Geobacter argillaceus TaxID=345631 RepID=A0A562WTA7_9BACT|nr:cytochrome c3 family protein [Geobacter argillaceus]TWJ33056.1 putative CXXCH cytochrome family protein [Geobacter argillaceus]
MKKALALIAAAALVAMASTAALAIDPNTAPGKSIVYSKHNLSKTGTGNLHSTTGTQICIYCHTPHNSSTAGGPIWNRNQSQFTITYQLYSGLGMQNISNKSGFTSDSISLFCMSCHDGSSMGGTMLVNIPTALPTVEATALTSFTTGLPGTAKANLLRGGTDGSVLKTTHPVNFEYKNGGGDLSTVTTNWINGLQGTKFPLYKSARSATQSFECSSCHSVHDDYNNPFLRDTNAGSKLCLGCHNK